MKIQQIANMSISTRRNGQGDGVSFSGIRMPVKNNGMPNFGVKIAEAPVSEGKTLFQEVKSLFSDAYGTVKSSYQKSEIKRIIVNPIENRLSKITAKSPQLTQAVKGAVCLAAVVGLYEYTMNKLNIDA